MAYTADFRDARQTWQCSAVDQRTLMHDNLAKHPQIPKILLSSCAELLTELNISLSAHHPKESDHVENLHCPNQADHGFRCFHVDQDGQQCDAVGFGDTSTPIVLAPGWIFQACMDTDLCGSELQHELAGCFLKASCPSHQTPEQRPIVLDRAREMEQTILLWRARFALSLLDGPRVPGLLDQLQDARRQAEESRRQAAEARARAESHRRKAAEYRQQTDLALRQAETSRQQAQESHLQAQEARVGAAMLREWIQALNDQLENHDHMVEEATEQLRTQNMVLRQIDARLPPSGRETKCFVQQHGGVMTPPSAASLHTTTTPSSPLSPSQRQKRPCVSSTSGPASPRTPSTTLLRTL